MSSTLGAHSGVDTNKLSQQISGGHDGLKHVGVPPKEVGIRDETNALSGIKGQVIEAAAAHGTKGLNHVKDDDRPCDGLSSNIKDAYVQEHGGCMTKDGKKCQKGCKSGECNC